MTDDVTGKEKLNPGWHYVPEYWPAIYLALNHAAGGLEIHDVLYYEENDSFYVELTEHEHLYDMGYRLDGSFVRSCFHAVKRGITSWVETTKTSESPATSTPETPVKSYVPKRRAPKTPLK